MWRLEDFQESVGSGIKTQVFMFAGPLPCPLNHLAGLLWHFLKEYFNVEKGSEFPSLALNVCYRFVSVSRV